MYIIRTVPAKIPDKRNYVVDQLDTVTVNNYDMRFLGDLDDDVILLEWDIAVAQHDLWNFRSHCWQSPQQIHVAPYVLYPTSLDAIVSPVWAHRTMIHDLPMHYQWIEFGDPVCDLFSTGMIYLPKHILERISETDDLVSWHDNITDCKIAWWYYYQVGEKVPVHWDVRPIHLHYDQEEFYKHGNVRHLGYRSGPRPLTSSNQHSVG